MFTTVCIVDKDRALVSHGKIKFCELFSIVYTIQQHSRYTFELTVCSLRRCRNPCHPGHDNKSNQ